MSQHIEHQEGIRHAIDSTGLADILERILDKGIVIAGDIKIQIADVDLINIKIRLLIASVDKAMEMGINWWQEDTFLSSKARESELQIQNKALMERLEKLEANIKA
jgi:hypothetical protein